MTPLERILAKVPHEGGKPKYIPLKELPVGSILLFTTKDPILPTEPEQIREVNGKPEELVTYMPAGTYKLNMLEWGVAFMTHHDENQVETQLKVKPLIDRLSITSTFSANCDQNYTTYRFQSGLILEITIGNITIRMEDFERLENKKRKVVHDRLYRGPRDHYKPLRNRRFR